MYGLMLYNILQLEYRQAGLEAKFDFDQSNALGIFAIAMGIIAELVLRRSIHASDMLIKSDKNMYDKVWDEELRAMQKKSIEQLRILADKVHLSHRAVPRQVAPSPPSFIHCNRSTRNDRHLCICVSSFPYLFGDHFRGRSIKGVARHALRQYGMACLEAVWHGIP